MYNFNNIIAYAGSGNQTFSIEYELVNMSSAGVCVHCSFLDPNTFYCVAVVHQQISQLSSSGLMNIESSHKFTRSVDTAYGCIEVVNLENYHIGVIGGVRTVCESESTLIVSDNDHQNFNNIFIQC